MKITVQEKIAELERRIVALEGRSTITRTTTTVNTGVDLEPELSDIWVRFEKLFSKVLRVVK